jgi:hypothetical protein
MLSLFIIAAVVAAVPLIGGPAIAVALAWQTHTRRTRHDAPEVEPELPSSLRFAS